MRGGSTLDEDARGLPQAKHAGPDLGDLGLDSDTDSGGTGENISAGHDPRDGINRDIDVHRMMSNPLRVLAYA